MKITIIKKNPQKTGFLLNFCDDFKTMYVFGLLKQYFAMSLASPVLVIRKSKT